MCHESSCLRASNNHSPVPLFDPQSVAASASPAPSSNAGGAGIGIAPGSDASGGASSTPSSTLIGSAVGAVLGFLVILIVCLMCICVCLERRKRGGDDGKDGAGGGQAGAPPPGATAVRVGAVVPLFVEPPAPAAGVSGPAAAAQVAVPAAGSSGPSAEAKAAVAATLPPAAPQTPPPPHAPPDADPASTHRSAFPVHSARAPPQQQPVPPGGGAFVTPPRPAPPARAQPDQFHTRTIGALHAANIADQVALQARLDSERAAAAEALRQKLALRQVRRARDLARRHEAEAVKAAEEAERAGRPLGDDAKAALATPHFAEAEQIAGEAAAETAALEATLACEGAPPPWSPRDPISGGSLDPATATAMRVRASYNAHRMTLATRQGVEQRRVEEVLQGQFAPRHASGGAVSGLRAGAGSAASHPSWAPLLARRSL